MEDLWFFLNYRITQGTDVYKIAKDNKLLKSNMTKQLWKMRGGIIMDHISEQIKKNPELKKLFI